jgi:hypothetical protein
MCSIAADVQSFTWNQLDFGHNGEVDESTWSSINYNLNGYFAAFGESMAVGTGHEF